jgi:hypothetical protein
MTASLKYLKKVYISLDSLLDTRLGALNCIDAGFAFDIATGGAYFEREQDSFTTASGGTLGPEKFRAYYSANRQKVVRASIKTKMHEFLGELCMQFVKQTLGTPHYAAVEIEVNMHPYRLSQAEASDIVSVLAYYLGLQYTITAVSLSPEQLTLDHVRENYCAMIMYDYHEWLNLHDLAIRKKPLKEVCLYLPKLYFGPVPSAKDLQSFADHSTTPFELSQHVLAPLVLVQYLPISLYCADIPEPPSVQTA